MIKKYSIDLIDEVTIIRFAEKPDILDIRKSIDDAAELKQKGRDFPPDLFFIVGHIPQVY
jgi:hypothetical protein